LPEYGGENVDSDDSFESMLAFLAAGFRAPLRSNGASVAEEMPVKEAGEG
jgi:hypothetical protein